MSDSAISLVDANDVAIAFCERIYRAKTSIAVIVKVTFSEHPFAGVLRRGVYTRD